MFTRVNGLGWGFGVPLASAQMNQLDIDHANSVDGAGGGGYAPVGALVFGGSGIIMTGAFAAQGLSSFTLAPNFMGGAACHGFFEWFNGASISLDAGASFTAAAGAVFIANCLASFGAGMLLGVGTFTGAAGTALAWHGSATFDTGAATFANGFTVSAGAVTFGSGFHISAGTVIIDPDVSMLGALKMVGPNSIELSADASIKWRPRVLYTNADHSVGVTSGDGLAPTGADHILIPPGVLGADRNLTLRSAGAKAGHRFRVTSQDNAFKVTLKQDDGTSIALVKTGAGGAAPPAGHWSWIELEHNGGANGWGSPIGVSA